MKIALAQINPTVGDFQRNTEKICSFIDRAKNQGARSCHLPGIGRYGLSAQRIFWIFRHLSTKI